MVKTSRVYKCRNLAGGGHPPESRLIQAADPFSPIWTNRDVNSDVASYFKLNHYQQYRGLFPGWGRSQWDTDEAIDEDIWDAGVRRQLGLDDNEPIPAPIRDFDLPFANTPSTPCNRGKRSPGPPSEPPGHWLS